MEKRNANSWTLFNTFTGHNAAVYALAEMKDEGVVLSAGGDGWIAAWESSGKNDEGILVAKAENQIFSLCTYQNLVVAGTMTGDIYWIDYSAKKILKNTRFHNGAVYAIIRIENKIFAVGGDGVVSVWDLNTLKHEVSLQVSNQGLRTLVFDKARNQLIIGASDNQVYFVDAESFEIRNFIQGVHQNSVFSLAILNPDTLLTGSRDAHLRIFDLNNLSLILEAPAHWYTINDICLIGENEFATASRDKKIRIWNNDGSLLSSIDVFKGGHVNSVNAILWLETEHMLWSASDDRTIKAFLTDQ